MFRSIGAFLAFLSAMLCIGVIVLGVRSRTHADVFLLKTPASHIVGAAGDHGGVVLAYSDLEFDGAVSTDGKVGPFTFMSPSPDEFKAMHDTLFDPTSTKFSFIGFKTAAGQANLTSQLTPRFSAILLPCWFLAIVLAILPLGVFRGRWTLHRRKRKGLCLGCGYDIRASTGRCPECGRDIPATTTTTTTRLAPAATPGSST